MLNNYTRYARIGNGHHGEVFLCFRIDARFPVNDVRRWYPVAMKSVRRDTVMDKYSRLKANRIALTTPAPSEPAVVDKLNTTELKIKKEIAIMKKLSHPNVVRLFEVIDDRMKEKVYLGTSHAEYFISLPSALVSAGQRVPYPLLNLRRIASLAFASVLISEKLISNCPHCSFPVMEYLGGGEIKWRTDNDEPTLTLAQTRRIVRDAILGLEYLHYQGIIHRDIKPANLLWTEDRHHVKIADFGVSHFSYHQRLAEAGEEGINRNELEDILMDESDLTKRAGTPAFLAPELIFEHFEEKNRHFVVSSLVPKFSSKHPSKPTITKAIDVWALGVTLYCLLFGKTPFLNVTEGGATEFALYSAICNKDWEVPQIMCRDRVPTGGRHPKKSSKHKQPVGAKVIGLLERFLQKDQTKRITLDEVKRYQWITEDLLNPSEWAKLTSPNRKVEVTKSEMFLAVSSVHFRWGLSGFGRGMSALFRPLKARSRTTPAGQYSTRDVGVKSDPHAGRLFPRGGSRKTSATSGVQDVHVYVRPRTLSEKAPDKGKGKGKAAVRNVSQPSSPAGLPSTSSSPALDAIRRQRSQMGILGHERQQRVLEGESSPTSACGSTPIDPAPKLEDIMSIVTWRPTKYPTPTTSLTPLLANIHADGTSTFRSPRSSRTRKPTDQHVSIVTPVNGGPPRTVSTLEGGFRPTEDMLGIYGPEGGLVPHATAAALNNFKRASSWGQGDETMDDVRMGMGITMGAAADLVSVTSVNAEINETVKLVGAGGIESLGSPVSPITPISAGGSAGFGRMGSGSGSAGEGMLGSGLLSDEGGGWRAVGVSGSAGSSGGAAAPAMNWEQLGGGITKWRNYRKKHHRQNASSSTLPWVDSLDDLTFGVDDSGAKSGPETSWRGKSREKRHTRQTESRGELTIEWMDDNYTTPGGYYGASMGPATQFWRHGRGAWSGSSTMTKSMSASSSGEDDGPHRPSPSNHTNGRQVVEVVRQREGLIDKFLSGEDSDSDVDVDDEGLSHDGDEESDYGAEGARRFGDDDVLEEGEEDDEESEIESDDEHVQQITIKSKSKGKMPIRH
ncbi:hypothetical protein D9756_003593 [Leucocoprinus leucothites]|uniref:Protein kinase domain-containing protein n=1 Tax=Leucocoprinus leucothites TaxID=201217 RepID=A0A8H5LJ94_9AGAR|nr:hypothetical protein D9756_003593 [Leucoagaricus leucothites]